MLIYLISLPIWNDVLPAYAFWAYAFWHFDGGRGDVEGVNEGESGGLGLFMPCFFVRMAWQTRASAAGTGSGWRDTAVHSTPQLKSVAVSASCKR
ncbi:hypothetical protein B0H11DRAFT_1951423 [Mycena galericulata]|nr:hypothetical protein B0H11DRAFT_1951423 [Mycena galericulata]